MTWAIHNAELVDTSRLLIPATDRGLLLGDGIFETMRTYDGTVFRLEDHLIRLGRAADFFKITLPWGHEQIETMISGLLRQNELESARVRLTVTRGPHTGSMSLQTGNSPTLLITADPINENLDDRLAAGTTLAVATVRFSEHNPIFKHKTLNRLPHLTARSEAEAAGADEALVLDERGNAACVSTGNIFVWRQRQLFTPPLSGAALPGVTRGVVLELAREEGIGVREDFFSPIMLAGADEVFMTNSVQGIVAVTRVGNQPVGAGRPGPIVTRLRALYGEMT